MSIISTEEIISQLSTKFNKIFYDREFICSVQEDFEVILKNTKTCCVVIFPVLGPQYLKAVQYQAKILDLAAFTLGSSRISCIAVCHRNFLIKKLEVDKGKMLEKESEEVSTSKRKRPERQLYVPPAQRGTRMLNENSRQCLTKNNNDNAGKEKKRSCKKKVEESLGSGNRIVGDVKSGAIVCSSSGSCVVLENEIKKECIRRALFDIDYLKWNYYLYGNFGRSLFLDSDVRSNENITAKYNFTPHVLGDTFGSYQIPLLSLTTLRKLFILKQSALLWQPKFNFICNQKCESKFKIFSLEDIGVIDEIPSIEIERIPLIVSITQPKVYKFKFEESSVLIWIKDESFRHISMLDSFLSNYYYIIQDTKLDEHDLNVEWFENTENIISINNQHSIANAFKIGHENIDKELMNLKANSSVLVTMNNNVLINNNNETVKEDRTIPNSIVSNTEIKSINESIIEKRDDHDEEKEIMRKTKENINRKSRPIMKYVDNTDELKIGEENNINNWEDLFDESGQLHENVMKEIFHKVGDQVTIVRAKEDYSDYSVKQIEELEHMVELYDFPASFETNDLIHAFREINSDAMYIKWVDNTHAILVLGSLSQAQKAMKTNHPLIKVRPMSAASNASLSTAYRHDLRPAMKRPQTNLQTARRLITTHLGAKSNVSRERSAKERNDLKEAKEMKRLMKKNEQDAWNGSLRSSLN